MTFADRVFVLDYKAMIKPKQVGLIVPIVDYFAKMAVIFDRLFLIFLGGILHILQEISFVKPAPRFQFFDSFFLQGRVRVPF